MGGKNRASALTVTALRPAENPLGQVTLASTGIIGGNYPVLRAVPPFKLIENAVLKIAGELDAMQLQVIPEYRRLKLISSLRILDSRLKSALVSLNGGTALKTVAPRQFSSRKIPV